MRFGRLFLTVVLTLLCTPVHAQLKPDMLILLDNSISMQSDVAVNPVDNPCNYGSAGSRLQSKAAAALCAMHDMVLSTGDAEFGLMTFQPYPTCTVYKDSGLLDVPLLTNNAAILAARFDNVGLGTATAFDDYFGATTPTGGALAAAKSYFEGTLNNPSSGSPFDAPTASDEKAACRSLNVILVTDGLEQCGGGGGCPVDIYASGSACPGAIADTTRPELQNLNCVSGCASGGYFNMATQRAWELYKTTVPSPSGPIAQKTVRTYVVGFGIDPQGTGDPRLENIAFAGGTDNSDPNYRAFYPQNQTELAIALSQIIADAQPPDEVCNGDDDDCDGKIDEGISLYCDLPGGHPMADLCTSPGETLCDGLDDDCNGIIDDGLLNACGSCGPIPDEICDAVDNDCDGRVDESTDAGDMCGSDVGVCRSGTVVCVSGAESCEGALGPGVETCDCSDNDCDGNVDENVDGSLCGGDSICVGCKCAPPCQASGEFSAICGTGLVASFLQNGACVCVVDDCDTAQCAADTMKRDGEVACAPNSDAVAPCLCQGGSCVAPCDGISCASDQICDSFRRQCVFNDCRGLGCKSGEVCNSTSGLCEPDPCEDVTCKKGKHCEAGSCVADPTTGPNQTGGVSDTGGAEGDADSKSQRYVFATGGSACSCQIVGGRPTQSSGSPHGAWLFVASLGLALRLRRRRIAHVALAAVSWLLLILLTAGCNIKPFCVTCVDATVDVAPPIMPDAGTRVDAGQQQGDASIVRLDGGTGDGGPLCTPKAETCNDMDDDCDFRVDEEVRPTDNNCNQTGVCAGTKPVCVGGMFGCHFDGTYEVDEVTCDNLDNDCDGLVDESFPNLNKSCEVGIGGCKATGKYVCAATGIDLRCNAVAKDGVAEVCDNVDNDCDGLIDEPKSDPGIDPSYVVDKMVKIANGMWIYKYEASRPDATASSSGNLTARSCSRAGRLPWVSVSFDEAVAACNAADMDLCTATAWQDACDGSGSCLWSYTPSGTNSCETDPSANDVWQGCNGHDVNAAPGNIGDPNNPTTDTLLASGAKARCFTEFSGGNVFDLSGNAKEWVDDASYTGDARALRGGSFNDLSSAMRCDYDLAAANRDIRLPTIGFRCCSTTAP